MSAEVKHAVPSAVQYEWQELERIMFVHFGPNTWRNREYDDLSVPLSEIDPKNLDTDQWCRAALSWGARCIIFVAKHVGGFCWWQTKASGYSVKNIPWKNGEGDLLADIADSCRRFGLRLGVYISPTDLYYDAYLGGGGLTSDPSKQEKYTEVYRTQLWEVLHNYGDLIELWFDGSNVLPISDILEEFTSRCVIFQSPLASIRWCGNEQGIVPYPSWSSLDRKVLATGVSTARHSDFNGNAWAPVEADAPLYTHNWFWSPDNETRRKSLDDLMKIYYGSVGRGAVMLLNSSPTNDGSICEGDMKRYAELGSEIDRRFGHPLAGETEIGNGTATITFDRPERLNHVIIREDIRYGERIKAYAVTATDVSGKETVIAEGSMVGHCRIEVFPETEAVSVQFRATDADGDAVVRDFSSYRVTGIDLEAIISSMKEEVRVTDDIRNGCGTFDGSESGTDIAVDLSGKIHYPGEYLFEFGGEVNIESASVEIDGTDSDRYAEIKDNAVIVNRYAQVDRGSSTVLKVRLSGSPCQMTVRPL